MAALRGVFVVALRPQPEVLLGRRFPTVEARRRVDNGAADNDDDEDDDEDDEIPRDAELLAGLLRVWTAAPEQELADRVCVRVGAVWPVVVLERDDYLHFAVPLVPRDAARAGGRLVDRPEVTVALLFLQDLAAFTKQLVQEDPRELVEKLAELNLTLTYAAPFGQVQDTPLAMARTLCRAPAPGDKQATSSGQKMPPWKPYLVRGKSQMRLTFREEVIAAQYDSDTVLDTWQVHGTVLCKAELEGAPDVTIAMQTGSHGRMTATSAHACVQAEDFSQARKLVFSPPAETFALCHYVVTDVPFLPIRAFYQMKEADAGSVRVLLQLKLDERFHNNFEYCQAMIPFSLRGTITQLDVSPTCGVVSLSANRQTLIWNIGQRFTGRNREVALPGTVYFQPLPKRGSDNGQAAGAVPASTAGRGTFVGGSTVPMPLSDASKTLDTGNADDSGSSAQVAVRPARGWGSFDEPDENTDLFCARNETAYVSMRFKLLEDNMSGSTLDPPSFAIYPNAKVKVTAQRELVAHRYLIWNSKGDARAALPPPAPLVPL